MKKDEPCIKGNADISKDTGIKELRDSRIERESQELNTEKAEEKDKGSNSTSAVERTPDREDDISVIEIFSALSDVVTNRILCSIAETGACSKKDLETLDAVVKEGESVVKDLRECGLIAVEKDAIVLTEKGRKVLEFIDRARNDELIRR